MESAAKDGNNMLTDERHQHMLTTLQSESRVLVSEVSQRLAFLPSRFAKISIILSRKYWFNAHTEGCSRAHMLK